MCIGQKNMSKLSKILNRIYSTPSSIDINPCRSITDLHYETKIVASPGNPMNLFSIIIQYPEHYMEIKHVQEYTWQDLIGNVGGYLGLFLGYSLLHLPALTLSAYSWLKTLILRRLKSSRKCSSIPKENEAEEGLQRKEGIEEDKHCSDITLLKVQVKALKHEIANFKRINASYSRKK